MGRELGGGAGQRAVEHGDLGIGAESAAQRDALVESRDKEQPAPRRGQRPRHRRGAEPVPVGLDHRGARRRCRLLREQPPIRDYAIEIDLKEWRRRGKRGRRTYAVLGPRASGPQWAGGTPAVQVDG